MFGPKLAVCVYLVLQSNGHEPVKSVMLNQHSTTKDEGICEHHQGRRPTEALNLPEIREATRLNDDTDPFEFRDACG